MKMYFLLLSFFLTVFTTTAHAFGLGYLMGASSCSQRKIIHDATDEYSLNIQLIDRVLPEVGSDSYTGSNLEFELDENNINRYRIYYDRLGYKASTNQNRLIFDLSEIRQRSKFANIARQKKGKANEVPRRTTLMAIGIGLALLVCYRIYKFRTDNSKSSEQEG